MIHRRQDGTPELIHPDRAQLTPVPVRLWQAASIYLSPEVKNMVKRLMMLAVVLIAAIPAWSQTTILCESKDGQYKECDISGPGRVVLSREISDTDCIEGRSWGTTRDGRVWVDKGCRAEFTLAERRFTNRRSRADRMRRGSSDFREQMITCESTDGTRQRCAVDTRGGVRLERQLSKRSCDFGRDWGHDSSGIWVTNGCRAEFAIRSDRREARLDVNAPTLLLCESKNNGRNRCRTDTTFGVQLYRQLSDNDCIFGRTWGYDNDGVWVNKGCRGEFTVGDMRSTGMISSGRGQVVVCESENNGRNHCRADTRNGVALSRQLSKNSCQFRRDWGFDQDGIWVNNGCRAEFALDRR